MMYASQKLFRMSNNDAARSLSVLKIDFYANITTDIF